MPDPTPLPPLEQVLAFHDVALKLSNAPWTVAQILNLPVSDVYAWLGQCVLPAPLAIACRFSQSEREDAAERVRTAIGRHMLAQYKAQAALAAESGGTLDA